jgi:hypothetical protein
MSNWVNGKFLRDTDHIDNRLDALQGKINSALGTSHTPGVSSCHFWMGNQSSGDEGWYRFRIQGKDSLKARTKEDLLTKMKNFYNTNCLA